MAGLDDLLAELFAPVGGVTMKRMFGGIGIFKEGLMFGLVSRDVLYFKANDDTKAPYEAEGFGQWTPPMKRTMAMPYWQVPERLFDEADEFADWARTAFDVAVTNRAAKKPAKRAAKRATGKAPAKRPKAATSGARSSAAKKKKAPKRR